MIPSSRSKNTLFTYDFYQPAIYKKFFNTGYPNNLVFSSGLFGGCLFSSNVTVSVLKEFENSETCITDTVEFDTEIEQVEIAPEVETMGENTGNGHPEDQTVIDLPKPKLKLMDAFTSYLTFLRKSVFQVTRGRRAKVITWSKGIPTVKNRENGDKVEEEDLEKVVIYGEYMPFERSETSEDCNVRDSEFPSQYPHVFYGFGNRVLVRDSSGDSFDRGDTCEMLPEQVRSVQGYIERMGEVFESDTGELAIQFPHVIPAFETYRSICFDASKETSRAVRCEDNDSGDTELEGSASYATACWNSEVFHDSIFQLDYEGFEGSDSLDNLSYKSFSCDDEDSNILEFKNLVDDTAQKYEFGDDIIMYPEIRGFPGVSMENRDRSDDKPSKESGLLKDPDGMSLEQKRDLLDQFQDCMTNDVPNKVEHEIFYDIKDDTGNVKRADQLPTVMLKWLGHFWGLEEELSPSLENVSKFHHVFTPLKVAATK